MIKGIKTFDFHCEHCGEVERVNTLPPNNIFKCMVCDKDSDIRKSDSSKMMQIRNQFITMSEMSMPGRPAPPVYVMPVPVPVIERDLDMRRCHECQWMGTPIIRKSFKKRKDDENGRFEFKISKHCMDCDEEIEYCSTLMNIEEAEDFMRRNHL